MGSRNDFLRIVVDPHPLSYSPPRFPSLYWPFPVDGAQRIYIYDSRTMWRFTLLWTLICIAAVHLVASGYACIIRYRRWKVMAIIPVVFLVIGGVEAVIAGNIIGGLISGIYTVGSFRMSTWIPLTWGITNALVLILASFALQGGL